MYDDNAWPDTAPISVFIAKRKRPKRIDIAVYAIGIAAAAHLIASMMYGLAVDKAPEAVVLTAEVPTWLMINVSVFFAGGTATVIVGLLRGRRWAPLGGRIAGGVYAAGCGVFGLSVMPPSGVDGAGFAWFYAIIAFTVAIAGAIGIGTLFGSEIDAYFAPEQTQVTHLGSTGPDEQPLGGYDRDWIAPTSNDQQNPPPYKPYGE